MGRIAVILKKLAQIYMPLDAKLMAVPGYAPLSQKLRVSRKYLSVTAAQKTARRYAVFYDQKDIATKTVLFETFWGRKISCNPLALYRGMAQDPRFSGYKFIWVTNTETGIPDDLAQDPRVSFVKHQQSAYLEALATAGILVNNTTFAPYFSRRSEQTYINTYHGIPLKKMGFDIDDTLQSIANTQRNFLQASHLLSGGDYTDRHLFMPYGITPLVTPALTHTGYPRIDMTQAPATAAQRDKLGISGKKPVVLYAPTWRGQVHTHRQEISAQIKTVKALQVSLSPDFDVVVSLHNLVLAKLKDLPKGVTLLPSDMDPNVAMAAADILISDYSSILVDFFAVDRPVILFVPDLVRYKDERGLYVDLADLPATLCHDLSAVIEATRAGRKPSSFPQYNTAINMLLPKQDGASTAAVLDAILTRPAQPAPQKKRILLAINALSNNGITTSLINLTHTINYNTHELYLIIDADSVDKTSAQKINYHKLNPACHVILRTGAMSNTFAETEAIYRILNPNQEPDAQTYAHAETAYRREALRLLGDTHFDVAIEFDGYSSYWAGLIAATNAKTKIICQHNDLHGEYTNERKAHKKLIAVFRSYKNFDLVAPVSEGVGQANYQNLEHHYRNADQVRVLRNTIDAEQTLARGAEPLIFSCPLLAQSDVDLGIKIVTVGRLSPEKNHARLIRAFQQLRHKGINATLFIAGTGSELKELQQLSAQLGVTDRVQFVGQLANPYPFIKAADCFVLSSNYEGQPMTLLEALVLQTPCIGTDIPGIRAVLENGKGILAEPSVAGLSEALEIFCQTPRQAPIAFDGAAYSQEVLRVLYEISANT